MKGKPKKAKAVLRKVAWFNRKQCPQVNTFMSDALNTKAKLGNKIGQCALFLNGGL